MPDTITDELNPFQCGNKNCDSKNNIPRHLRNIWCIGCKKYFHVKCCDVNTKQYNAIKNAGDNWLCFGCRSYTKSEKCGSCRKTVQVNNLLISCSDCKLFFHFKCSKIYFDEFQHMTSWSCDFCIAKLQPFYGQKNEELLLTLQAKEQNFGEHINLVLSFSIQSLLDNIPGEGWSDEENYIFDLTHSQYYTPSEFLSSKFPKKSFSMFHINIVSLSSHLDVLKMST